MRKLLFILLIAAAGTLAAQDIIYSRQDSIFITKLLKKHHRHKMPAGKQILAIAGEFIGNKYVAGTLEKGKGEPLVINTKEVDCTTFVEQVLAIYATIKEGKDDFRSMCINLQRIRYREGKRCGYASRLHYISQWIADTAKQHFIKEIDYGTLGKELQIDLHFMSSHPASYKPLKEDSLLIKEIKRWEKPLCGTTAKFIPKERLSLAANKLPVQEGDIIALTTNIKGLDVVHMGIAFFRDGELHLLHASSAREEVIRDNKTLYEYQKDKKSHTGIRVFRAE